MLFTLFKLVIPKKKLTWVSDCKKIEIEYNNKPKTLTFGCFKRIEKKGEFRRDPECLLKCKLEKLGAKTKAEVKQAKMKV